MKPMRLKVLSFLLFLIPLAVSADIDCLCYNNNNPPVGGSWSITKWTNNAGGSCADLANVGIWTKCVPASSSMSGKIVNLPGMERKPYDGPPVYNPTPTPTNTPTPTPTPTNTPTPTPTPTPACGGAYQLPCAPLE